MEMQKTILIIIVVSLLLCTFGTTTVQGVDEGNIISKNADYSTYDLEFVQSTDTIYMKIWSSVVGDNPKTKKWEIIDSQAYKEGGSLSPDGNSPGGTKTFVANAPASNFAAGEAYLTMQLRSGKNNYKVTETITILGGGNQPPPAPSWIEPYVTNDNTPRISWESVTDPNSDTVYYSIKIGTTSGGSDVLPETSTGTDPYYDVVTPMSDGLYCVNVRSNDGILYSDWHQENLMVAAEPSPWSTENVDGAGWNTLAYDPDDGYPSIGYPDFDTYNVMFAHWNGVSWDTEIVDNPGNELGGRVSLAYDPNDGNPSLCYLYSGLKFAHWTGTSWDIDVIASKFMLWWEPSLAYDHDGNPSISCLGGKGKTGGLNFYSFNPSTNSWETELVDACGLNKYLYTSLAYDTAGNPSIAYDDDNDYDVLGVDTLKFAHWNPVSESWDVEIVETGVNGYGYYASLAYDPTTGYPSIVHARDSVRFLSWNGNSWDLEIIEDGKYKGGTSLVYDSSGTAYVSYYSHESSEPSLVKLATRTGSNNWDIEIVDIIDSNTDTSLKFDSDGNPSISYNDYSTDELKFAHRNPSV
jgi:hypothetical protein